MPSLAPASGAVRPQLTGAAAQRRPRTAYLLLLPGLAWLGIFFVVPIVSLFFTSLQAPTEQAGIYQPALQVSNYLVALQDYWPQFIRSFIYSGIATVLALVIAYPLAYFIAFRAGPWRALLLVLVVAPFFASFLLRTYAWRTILADEGLITSFFNALNLLPQGRILNTPIAVVLGLTYNFLPFMILPLYAALERIDPRLIEAASDLYASPFTGFRKVVWPLGLPGVVAGTLLTFIPASGDYINATLLGGPGDRMVGNAIQTNFLQFRDYPIASALSFILMAIILTAVFLYVRRAGTEDLI
ncbi:MAG: ABC transporter permease [Candidatus Nanopelagicales bacterium]|jgi:spermidine/putrescine transport system permease protein|nr:ABC transporter permease [Candidatus Nanopelagicales bacterium]MDP4715883.1 ABC transporter permease [Candidatus Nanopelagicales bacterium]MDP4905821.1 ABC transporter permease [Candidatus Nanopelagicales bacterium]MDP5095787.1 ABC transporter permease [Candidatus Nanopelagicales bacterium]